MNKVFEIGVLGFGGENGVEVYILFKCYFITLNIKFIIGYGLLEMSNNYVIPILYISISKENKLNSQKLLLG